jgi:hypothetical protein
MTKKDYELIAGYVNVLRVSYRIGSEALEVLENQTEGLCELLEQDNPRFNRDTFLKACGLVGLTERN